MGRRERRPKDLRYLYHPRPRPRRRQEGGDTETTGTKWGSREGRGRLRRGVGEAEVGQGTGGGSDDWRRVGQQEVGRTVGDGSGSRRLVGWQEAKVFACRVTEFEPDRSPTVGRHPPHTRNTYTHTSYTTQRRRRTQRGKRKIERLVKLSPVVHFSIVSKVMSLGTVFDWCGVRSVHKSCLGIRLPTKTPPERTSRELGPDDTEIRWTRELLGGLRSTEDVGRGGRHEVRERDSRRITGPTFFLGPTEREVPRE